MRWPQSSIDLAVHSLKDLPTELASKFEIAAIPAREDPRDALCSAKYPRLKIYPRAREWEPAACGVKRSSGRFGQIW